MVPTLPKVHFAYLNPLVCILSSVESTSDVSTQFGIFNICWFEYAECTLTIPTYVGVDPWGFIEWREVLCDFLAKRANPPRPPRPTTEQKSGIISIRLRHRRLVVHPIGIRSNNRIHQTPPPFIIACRLPPAACRLPPPTTA